MYRFPCIPPGLILGTSECMQMLPRLVKSIHTYGAKKLRNRPRKLLFATESVATRSCLEGLLRAFSKLPFSPSQFLSHCSVD